MVKLQFWNGDSCSLVLHVIPTDVSIWWYMLIHLCRSSGMGERNWRCWEHGTPNQTRVYKWRHLIRSYFIRRPKRKNFNDIAKPWGAMGRLWKNFKPTGWHRNHRWRNDLWGQSRPFSKHHCLIPQTSSVKLPWFETNYSTLDLQLTESKSCGTRSDHEVIKTGRISGHGCHSNGVDLGICITEEGFVARVLCGTLFLKFSGFFFCSAGREGKKWFQLIHFHLYYQSSTLSKHAPL